MTMTAPATTTDGAQSERGNGRGVLLRHAPTAQSRRMSVVEAAANVLLGMVLSLALQVLIFPVLGVEVSLRQHLSLLAVFTFMSFLRGYLLRRLFTRVARALP